MAKVFPFPLASRRKMIERQARYASSLNPTAAERHIQRQIKIQHDAMLRRGIREDLIASELRCLENSIRAQLVCTLSGGAR
jgi:hypothetical protein